MSANYFNLKYTKRARLAMFLAQHIITTESVEDFISSLVRAICYVSKTIDYKLKLVGNTKFHDFVQPSAKIVKYYNDMLLLNSDIVQNNEYIIDTNVLIALIANYFDSLPSEQKDKIEEFGLNQKSLLFFVFNEKIESKSISIPGCRDLTDMAKQGLLDATIERESEINFVCHGLLKRTKRNVILVGHAGVGKTKIVEGLAQKIVEGKVPKDMLNRQILEMSLQSIIAPSGNPAETLGKLQMILEMCSASNTILFIDEIHRLMTPMSGVPINEIVSMLKTFMARPKFSLIGTTTYSEYEHYIVKDAALQRRMQELIVEPLTRTKTIKVLEALKGNYIKYHKILDIDNSLLENVVSLADRFLHTKMLPDSALDLLDEAIIMEKLNSNKNSEELENLNTELKNLLNGENYEKAYELDKKISKIVMKGSTKPIVLTKESIAKAVQKYVPVPIETIMQTDERLLCSVDKTLTENIFGQNIAVMTSGIKEASKVVSAAERNRPIFVCGISGPEHSGKTTTVEIINDYFFGNRDSLLEVNLAEYSDPFTVSKLIGAPPGYVGYDDGRRLTAMVRKKSHRTILFRSPSKCHPAVLDLINTILTTGFLSDSTGDRVSFKNTIIFFLENSENKISALKKIGFDLGISEKEIEKVTKYQYPQIIKNSIDFEVQYNRLSKENLKEILLNKYASKTKNLSKKKLEDLIELSQRLGILEATEMVR